VTFELAFSACGESWVDASRVPYYFEGRVPRGQMTFELALSACGESWVDASRVPYYFEGRVPRGQKCLVASNVTRWLRSETPGLDREQTRTFSPTNKDIKERGKS
jgi:hypothetical protein